MTESLDPIFKLLPKAQIDEVLNQPMCDIEPCFMGFTNVYKNLSEIVPKHWTVIDLGCAYNPQCFYFKDHKEYIAVDISDCKKFKTDNCKVYEMPIEQFIKEHGGSFNIDQTFAICSYVPPCGGDNGCLTRSFFKNVFVYYPSGHSVSVSL